MRARTGIRFLSLWPAHRTSAAVPELFDMRLRAMRRDRAARIGAEPFLLERAFDDSLERIMLMNRRFESAMLIGCPVAGWPERLRQAARNVAVRDPGMLFARIARGAQIDEDRWEPQPQSYDLVLATGTLDTVNDLPLALQLIRYAMKPDGLFIGSLSGGDTLPRLREAMHAADALAGGAAAHVHPRIEPSALSGLLTNAGFERAVVDVDRVQVSYPSLDGLVADLRAMGATNVLTRRAPPLTRSQAEAAATCFARSGNGGRTVERFELLHFGCWTPRNG